MVNIKQFLSGYWNNPDPRTREMNHNIVYSMVLKAIGIVISILTIPFTLHYLDQYEYGVWLTIFSVLTWINVLDIGLGNGMKNKLSEAISLNRLELGREYVSSTFALLSIISVAAIVIFLSISSVINWASIFNIEYDKDSIRRVINVAAVCLFVNFTLRTIGIVHISYQKNWINDLLTVIGTFISMIWIALLKYDNRPSLMKVALAFSIPLLLVYAIAIPITFLKFYPEITPAVKSVKLSHFKSLGSLGIQFFVLQISGLIIYATSNLIISHLFSPAEVTPYGIAYRYYWVLTLGYGIIIAPLWTAITDAYTRKEYEWIHRNMKKMFNVWLLICILGCLMTLFSSGIYRIWVGPEVHIPILLSCSVCLFNLVLTLSMLLSNYCNGIGELRNSVAAMGFAAVIYIPLAIAMGRKLGSPGIGFAMSLVLLIPVIVMAIQYFLDKKKWFRFN